jgi:four helix bundle protein
MTIPYKNLIIWQKSFSLACKIYKITESFPQKEIYGLSSQIQRAAVSIPSNIAEGSKRTTKKDFIHFLHVALGSCAELETQILLSKEIGYITEKQSNEILKDIDEVLRILGGFIKKA